MAERPETRRANLSSLAVATFVALSAAVVFIVLLASSAPSASAAQGIYAPPQQVSQIPDPHEPNDTPAQIKPIPATGYISLTFMTTSGAFTDTDWFAVSIANNQIITLTAARLGGVANIDIDAFLNDGVTPAGTQLSSGPSASVVVSNTSGVFNSYFVRISNAIPFFDAYRIDYVIANLPVVVATNTPIGLVPDPYEPNDSIAEANIITGTRSTASFIAVGARIDSLGFVPFAGRPTDTADWFQFYGRGGSIYQVTTLNVQPGVETVLAVYQPVADPNNPNLALVAPVAGSSNPNNRFQAGQRGSQVTFQLPANTDGMYWVRVTNTDPSPRTANQTYSLQVQEILFSTATPGPPGTPTLPPPTSTPFPGTPDRFEYNGSFEQASLIAPNATNDNLNFVPWQPPTQDTFDNDFYRLPVKQGIYYTCQTLNLAPGVDTNIIIYNQDRVGLGGNDDLSVEERNKGNFSSRFSWLATYTGNAFVLVGEVNPPLANEAGAHIYSLRCDIGLPATNTPTPGPTFDPNAPSGPGVAIPDTPEPPEATMTPYPTPRPAQNLPVRPISDGATTPTPQSTDTVRVVSVNVQVFNDHNKNNLLDPGEGIGGVSVRLADEQSGVPLAQTLTDADGRVNISVVSPGPVRLSVPLFGYTTLINDTTASVRISVATTVALPTRIP
jgi:hypothetical protein